MAYKVFIVCGEPILTKRLVNALDVADDEFEYTLHRSSDGIIQKILQFPTDVIIFDVGFDRQGVDVLQLIKSDPRTSNIPILSVVDFESPEIVQLVFSAGTESIIGFTFTTRELIQRLMIVIQKGVTIKHLKQGNNKLNDLTSAINSAGNSIIIIDKNGRISWVNDGFRRVYESSSKELDIAIGEGVFSENVNSTMRQAMIRCRDNAEYVVYENTWVTPTGKTKFIQTSLTPIFDEIGNFSHIIAIESDITDLKYIEKTLEEKNEKLLNITQNLEHVNAMLAEQRAEVVKQAKLLEDEKVRSENLLKNILPWEVARSLQKKGVYKPKKFKEVTVLFTDFVGFSKLISKYDDIEEFLGVLGHFFESFDEIVSRHFIEKIKTVGDSYMCVGGIPRANHSHAFDTVLAALEIKNLVKAKVQKAKLEDMPVWNIRIGVHTGSVIAGVIGKNKFAYDIWGDTVNTASRMESADEEGRVNISETTYNYIKDYFCCISRGKIPAKNIGEIDMYFVDRIKPEYSEDEDGIIPNATFRKILASF